MRNNFPGLPCEILIFFHNRRLRSFGHQKPLTVKVIVRLFSPTTDLPLSIFHPSQVASLQECVRSIVSRVCRCKFGLRLAIRSNWTPTSLNGLNCSVFGTNG